MFTRISPVPLITSSLWNFQTDKIKQHTSKFLVLPCTVLRGKCFFFNLFASKSFSLHKCFSFFKNLFLINLNFILSVSLSLNTCSPWFHLFLLVPFSFTASFSLLSQFPRLDLSLYTCDVCLYLSLSLVFFLFLSFFIYQFSLPFIDIFLFLPPPPTQSYFIFLLFLSISVRMFFSLPFCTTSDCVQSVVSAFGVDKLHSISQSPGE